MISSMSILCLIYEVTPRYEPFPGGSAARTAMTTRHRRIAISFMETEIPCTDETPPEGYEWYPFSFGAYRVLAAAVAAFPDDDVRIFRGNPERPEHLINELEAFDPDVFGGSCYVWSFAPLLEVSKQLKARRANRTVVLGGPCAHPGMFTLEPFAPLAKYVDALVTREGEEIFTDILRLPSIDAQSLATVPGVTVRTPRGWEAVPARQVYRPLDELPSPFRMGLYPPRFTPHVERFRGCPLSCSFCEWGVQENLSRVASKEWMIEEFETFRRLDANAVYLVDAGINLSSRAFHNLAAAEREVRLLRDVPLVFMAYPDYVRDEHVDFLSQVKIRHGSVGLQSTNAEMLRRLNRRFDEQKFRHGMKLLTEVSEITVEIILGLPGDNPDSFMRTLDTVMTLGNRVCALVYHCLVLPDGLLTRAPEGADLKFDPYTLKVSSCQGWTERQLHETHERLADIVHRVGGRIGDHWYQVVEGKRGRGNPGLETDTQPAREGGLGTIVVDRSPDGHGISRPEVGESQKELGVLTAEALSRAIAQATRGAWRMIDAKRDGDVLVLRIGTDRGEVILDVETAAPGRPSYRVIEGLAWSHRGDAKTYSAEFLPLLSRAVEQTRPLAPDLQKELARAS